MLQVPGFVQEYIFSELDFHDGSKYEVKVVACNMAGMCTSNMTATFLQDNSPPTTGNDMSVTKNMINHYL